MLLGQDLIRQKAAKLFERRSQKFHERYRPYLNFRVKKDKEGERVPSTGAALRGHQEAKDVQDFLS